MNEQAREFDEYPFQPQEDAMSLGDEQMAHKVFRWTAYNKQTIEKYAKDAIEMTKEAQALLMLQQVVEWGEEECTEHDHSLHPSTIPTPSRFNCYECRQELKELANGK